MVRELDRRAVWLPSLKSSEFTSIPPCFGCVVSVPLTDGSSVPLLDAMRANFPVIAYLTNGSAEWVVNGITWWTSTVGNPVTLADAIQNAFTATPSRRELVTDNAARLMERVGGWDEGIEKLVKAISGAGGSHATH
jgi:glycosyltransferase involved in cell wall biosynthesis